MIAQNTLRISFSLNVLLVVSLYVLCPRMHLIVQHIQIAREEWKYILRKMSPSIAFCVVVTLINISSKDPVWSKSWFSQSPPACKGTSLSAFSKCPEGLQQHPDFLLPLAYPPALSAMSANVFTIYPIQHHPKSILPTYSLLWFAVLADHVS